MNQNTYTLKIFISFLVLIHSIIASPYLVKNHHSIVLEKGKLFSINDENKKYKFESINFELELINKGLFYHYSPLSKPIHFKILGFSKKLSPYLINILLIKLWMTVEIESDV